MNSHPTNRQLSEEEKRLVRAGYYRKYDKGMQEVMFNELSEEQIAYYVNYEEPFSKKFKNFLVGLAGFLLMVALWTSPIWISTGWNWLFPVVETQKTTQDEEDSDCNPNYSPCIPNVSYDLDCADVGHSVSVIGNDQYGLDGDNDREGCESY